MTTLYLNVPKDKVDGEGKKSCAGTLKSAAAMPFPEVRLCSVFPAALLCQTTEQQAQDNIKQLKPTGETTGSGMVRYDVHMADLMPMPYCPAPSSFGRTGVLVVTAERQ
jgi:hypothetical protein